MQVETFEINEVASDGTTDHLDEQSVALIGKLELVGQSRLIRKSEDGAASVMPYQAMTAEEVAVYEILFPARDLISRYDAGPIPLRALQVAALAVELHWFSRLEVWHKRVGSAKEDPILVGIVGGPNSWDIGSRFLLARWGDALRPYGELVAEAAVICRAKLHTAVASCRSRLDLAAAMIASSDNSTLVAWAHRNGPMIGGDTPPSEG